MIKRILTTIFCQFAITISIQAQTDQEFSRFTTFNEGQEFTAIAVDNVNYKVWAGTEGEGIFNLSLENDLQTSFSTFVPGIILDSDPYNYNVTDIAVDNNGRVYITHDGTSATLPNGGVYQVNSSGNVVDFDNERNAFGLGSYIKRGGLPGGRINSIEVDVNNRVWVVNNYQLLISGGESIVTPGAIGYRDSGDLEFKSYGGWYTTDGELNAQPAELPYPANTRITSANVTATQQTRSMRAISADKTSVWFGSFGYSPAYDESNYIPPRVLQYDLSGTAIAQFSITEMGFSGGVPTSILSNNEIGVWVTISAADSGFSIKIGDAWSNTNNLDFSKIVPPGTRFNLNAIWKDDFDRVFIGSNNGLIVFNGVGDPLDQKSYRIYTKQAIDGFSEDNELNIIDSEMLSNNITSGASDSNSNIQWLASNNGIMRAILPLDFGLQVYHINDYGEYDISTMDNDDNITLLKSIQNQIERTTELEDQQLPGVVCDNASATIFRYFTPIAPDYYKQGNESQFIWFVGPGINFDSDNPNYKDEYSYSEIESFVNTEQYKDQYGYFELKSLESYNENPNVDELEYVEFIYHHPKYINDEDFASVDGLQKKYSREDFTIIGLDSDETNAVELFKNHIRVFIPPILIIHDIWSSVESMQTMEDKFISSGFEESMIVKAWKYNKYDLEKTYDEDKHIIFLNIDKLKYVAAKNSISAGKVNIVAHGRGGLHARAYIEEINPNIKFRDDVNSLVTLNTPHLGTQLANLILDERILNPTSYKANQYCEDMNSSGSISASCVEFNDLNLALGQEIGQFVRPFIFKDLFSFGNTYEGAKNLLVENDTISRENLNNHFHFIEKLNSDENLSKMKGVPFHVVSSEFKYCPDSSCGALPGLGITMILELSTSPIKTLKKTLKGAMSIAVLAAAAGYKSIEEFNEALYFYEGKNDSDPYIGKNDAQAPTISMAANLEGTNFHKHFEGIPHSEKITLVQLQIIKGVNENSKVCDWLISLLSGNVYDTTEQGKFSMAGVNSQPMKKLTYPNLFEFSRFESEINEDVNSNSNLSAKTFSGVSSNSQTSATNEVTSRVFINRAPEIFNSVSEGDTLKFNVYSENVDNIIISFQSENDEESVNAVVIDNPVYENNVELIMSGDLEYSGEVKITAYGFQEGEMGLSSNYVTFNLGLPDGIILESISFDVEDPIVLNQDNFSFDVLGMYSDGIERKITNNENLVYEIEDTFVISESDDEGFKALSEGVSVLQASIDGLETSILVTVDENPSLLQTILTSFYGELNDDSSSIAVSWNTLREFENETFVLEASYGDAENFTEVNSQAGNGTSTIAAEFDYEDTDIAGNETIFYRLKMIDVHGLETFSTTIEISLEDETLDINEFSIENNNLTLFPNPYNKIDKLSLNVNTSFSDNDAYLELYSMAGQKLSKQALDIVRGHNHFNLSASNKLSPGVYLVKLTTKGFVKTVQLIIE